MECSIFVFPKNMLRFIAEIMHPSPLVDCGVIINAKEDLINFCQIIHCMLVCQRAVDGPKVSTHTWDQAFAEMHSCQRAVDGSY